MKRLRDEVSAPTKESGSNRITLLLPELHPQIGRYLTAPLDLQRFLRFLTRELLEQPFEALDREDPRTYDERTLRWLATWLGWFPVIQPELYRLCCCRLIHSVHNHTGFVFPYKSSGFAHFTDTHTAKETEALVGDMRRLANNVHYPLLCFIQRELCMRCENTLSVINHWAIVGPEYTVKLCAQCEKHMLQTMKCVVVPPGSDHYAWVSAEHMKRLCGLKSQIRASDFAQQNKIRSTRGSGVNMGHLKKEFYFLADVQKHIKVTT